MANGKRSNVSSEIKDEIGNIIRKRGEILKKWKEYISKIYKDSKPKYYTVNSLPQNAEGAGSSILKSEVIWAIKTLMCKKATGVDEIPAEVLKKWYR